MKNNYFIFYSFDDMLNDPLHKNLIGIYSNQIYARKQIDKKYRENCSIICEYRSLEKQEIEKLSYMPFILQEDKNHFTDCGEKIFTELVNYNQMKSSLELTN